MPRFKFSEIFQDTAKSIFDPQSGVSLLDLNRAGAGLMEIVSEPDMRYISCSEIPLHVHLLLLQIS
jgi:Asp-tRNA(Asn)/Glu-tRNA(Gln) amidotransferase B subunit